MSESIHYALWAKLPAWNQYRRVSESAHLLSRARVVFQDYLLTASMAGIPVKLAKSKTKLVYQDKIEFLQAMKAVGA